MKYILALGSVDRRVLYVLLAVVLVLPLVRPIGLPISIRDNSKQVYDKIDELKPGARVIMDINYDVSAIADIESQAVAILNHLLDKDAKVIAISFVPQGPIIADRLLGRWLEAGKEYGKDFCNLGYLAGGETAMNAFIRDLPKACPSDYMGSPVSSLEVMNGIRSGADADLLIYFSSSYTAEWIRQAGPLDVPIIAGVITVLGPAQEAFVQSGQLKGLLVGMRGGAEYELMIRKPGPAVAAMDAQSMGHMLFILFIVFGNMAYLSEKNKRAKRS